MTGDGGPTPDRRPTAVLSGSELFERVYGELRSMAAARLIMERPGQTLSATALVHEVYLRLLGTEAGVSFENRRQFFAAAAESMRRILIDSARRKHARKRAGLRAAIDLESLCGAPGRDPGLMLAVDDALARLATADPEAAELVRLRIYVGASMPESAAILDRPLRTTERLWTFARAWLARELRVPPR
jgi:RNA polymerase sigma factor (TIGR02999 family)